MTAQDINILMSDAGLVRHRQELQAIVKNAQAYLLMEKCGENFSDFYLVFCKSYTLYSGCEDER